MFMFAALPDIAARQVSAWQGVGMGVVTLFTIFAAGWQLRPGVGQYGKAVAIAVGGAVVAGLLLASGWISNQTNDTVVNGGGGGSVTTVAPGGGVGN